MHPAWEENNGGWLSFSSMKNCRIWNLNTCKLCLVRKSNAIKTSKGCTTLIQLHSDVLNKVIDQFSDFGIPNGTLKLGATCSWNSALSISLCLCWSYCAPPNDEEKMNRRKGEMKVDGWLWISPLQMPDLETLLSKATITARAGMSLLRSTSVYSLLHFGWQAPTHSVIHYNNLQTERDISVLHCEENNLRTVCKA